MEAVLHVNATQTAAELSMFLTQSRIPRESGQEENDDDDEEEEEEGAGNDGKGSAEGQDEKDEKEDEEDEEDEEDTEAAIILKEIQSRVDAAYAVTQEVRYVLVVLVLQLPDNNLKIHCSGCCIDPSMYCYSVLFGYNVGSLTCFFLDLICFSGPCRTGRWITRCTEFGSCWRVNI